MGFRDKLIILWKLKFLTMGLGFGFFIISVIPILGFLGLNLGAIAGTVLYIEYIKPALDSGKIVICDRFTDSTVVYQGYGREIGMDNVEEITRLALGKFEPDLTILLDVEAPSGLEKAIKAKSKSGKFLQGDRLEQVGVAFHQKVREGYLKLSQKHPKRIKVIKIAGDIEETHKKICEIVFKYLLDEREER